MAKLNIWNYSIGHESHDGWHYGPDSAGGVSVLWSFKNNTDKTIKYANFYFIPYNAVNDAVECRIKRKSENGVRFTGPLSPGGYRTDNVFSQAWYNNSIASAKLSYVHIEYMDGVVEKVFSSDIDFSVPEDVRAANQSSGGCYVATCVYGSYDCPQVWTLRRYRDETLASTWYGRAFIRTYYALSPTLVKWFGDTNWFKKMWHGKLDRMVKNLQEKGVESTPYEDKNW